MKTFPNLVQKTNIDDDSEKKQWQWGNDKICLLMRMYLNLWPPNFLR